MLDWLDVRTAALLIFLAAGTIFFGRRRHEPGWAVAASTGGVVLTWAALFWAGALGREAVLVAGLTGAGIFLMVHGQARAKASRPPSTPAPDGRP